MSLLVVKLVQLKILLIILFYIKNNIIIKILICETKKNFLILLMK